MQLLILLKVARRGQGNLNGGINYSGADQKIYAPNTTEQSRLIIKIQIAYVPYNASPSHGYIQSCSRLLLQKIDVIKNRTRAIERMSIE